MISRCVPVVFFVTLFRVWFCMIAFRSKNITVVGEEEICVSSEERQCLDPINNNNNNNVNHENKEHHGDTVEWIRKNGGFVDSRQVVRLNDPENVNSGYGVFANQNIQKGELLLSVPWNCIIKSPWADFYEFADDIEDGSEYDFDDEVFGYDFCGLLNNVANEMRLGEQSFFAPYVRHLNLQPHGQLPEAWTDQAKKLLMQIKGADFYMNFQDRHVTDFVANNCPIPQMDDFITNVAMLITQRTEDDLMIPYYEIYNHQNGYKLNTWMVKNWRQSVDMYARYDIQKGQEIYNSYNFCNNCNNRIRSFDFGTMEIFNDYGFIERYPQRWILSPNFRFDLNYNDDDDKFEVSLCPWCQQQSNEETIQFLQKELERLESIHTTFKHEKTINDYPGILPHEWNLLWEFHQAFMVAITQGLNAAK